MTFREAFLVTLIVVAAMSAIAGLSLVAFVTFGGPWPAVTVAVATVAIVPVGVWLIGKVEA
jgi:hypothetical protein